jgi:tetratricopeptide (TPR) repeat protein
LEIKPEYEELILVKVSANIKKKNYKAAMINIDSVLVINPKNTQALDFKGNVLQHQKDYQGGVEAFSKAIEIAPQDFEAFYDRGICKAYLKKFDEALTDITRGMEIDSMGKWIGYNNIAFFIKFEEKDFQGSLKYFDDALKLNPKFAYAYNNRGYAKLQLNDIKGARQDITKSIELDPENSYAFRTMALLLLAENKENQACKQLKKAMDLGYADDYDDEVENLQKLHCK